MSFRDVQAATEAAIPDDFAARLLAYLAKTTNNGDGEHSCGRYQVRDIARNFGKSRSTVERGLAYLRKYQLIKTKIAKCDKTGHDRGLLIWLLLPFDPTLKPSKMTGSIAGNETVKNDGLMGNETVKNDVPIELNKEQSPQGTYKKDQTAGGPAITESKSDPDSGFGTDPEKTFPKIALKGFPLGPPTTGSVEAWIAYWWDLRDSTGGPYYHVEIAAKQRKRLGWLLARDADPERDGIDLAEWFRRTTHNWQEFRTLVNISGPSPPKPHFGFFLDRLYEIVVEFDKKQKQSPGVTQ